MKILRSDNYLFWLPLLAVILQPFGRSVEIVVILMAIISIYDLASNYKNIRHSPGFKLFTVFFLCYWIPALISLVDAINLKHSASSVFGVIRFYLAGVFIISRLSDYKSHLWFCTGLGLVLTFWSIDAWIQLFAGFDVFGKPPYSDARISGIFGENPRLGLMFIPFLGGALSGIKERYGIYYAIIFLVVAVSSILISGDRSSWVSLLVALLFWLILFKPKNIKITKKIVLFSFGCSLLLFLAVMNTSQFQTRLDNSLVGFEGGYESINTASSFRLPIWEIAIKMFVGNPINGVGVRGFRYAYPLYAKKDDIFVDFSLPVGNRIGASHPHQIVLELMSDTGIIGFFGYIISLWIIFYKWRIVALTRQGISTGYLVSLIAVLFPINSHLSTFSSNWAQVLWMLVALCVSALTVDRYSKN